MSWKEDVNLEIAENKNNSTSQNNVPSIRPKKKKNWILRVILSLLFVSFMSLLGKYMVIDISSETKIAEELKKFEEAGISLNVEDWAPEPVADDENAAIILAEAFKKLTEDEKAQDEIASFITGEPEDMVVDKDLIRKFVADNEQCVDIVREALKRSKCRYGVDYSTNMEDLPHSRKIMNLEKVILSQAMFYIEEKNQEKAVEYLLLAMKLAGTLRDEPLLISQAILIVSHEYINNVMMRILDEFSLTDEQCQQLIDEFTKHKQFEYGKSIIVEQLLSLRRQKGLCDGTIDPSQFNLPWYYVSPLKKQDYGIQLEHTFDEIGLHSKPLGLTKYRASAAVNAKWQTYKYPKFALMSIFAYPIYSGIEDDSTLRLARLEIARAALAIQIYFNRNKKLPENLAELVEQKILESEPVDPFSEKSLRYVKDDEKTYTIYTVGKNMYDNGGLPKESEYIDDFALHLTLPVNDN